MRPVPRPHFSFIARLHSSLPFVHGAWGKWLPLPCVGTYYRQHSPAAPLCPARVEREEQQSFPGESSPADSHVKFSPLVRPVPLCVPSCTTPSQMYWTSVKHL